MTESIKIVAALFCLLLSPALTAQTVKVKKESARIKGENIEGVAVELNATAEEVNSSLMKYLKSLGKVKQSEGIFVLTDALIYGSTYSTPVYAAAKGKETEQAWFGINKTEWLSGEVDKMNGELEKLAYDFGLKFYRDKIQAQIDESMRALLAVEKQQQRFSSENKNLNVKLEGNKQEKIRLEKSIAENKTENELLLRKIEKNKKDQDSIVVVAEQVKKVVEMHRERQRNVK
jgi:hypothetical protein